MRCITRSVLAATVATLVATSASAQVAPDRGNYGGGQIPDLQTQGGRPVSILATVRPSRDLTQVRFRVTIRGTCGATVISRRVPLGADGTWVYKGHDVARNGSASSVVSDASISGALHGSSGEGVAQAHLRVRNGRRVRRCTAEATPFQLRHVTSATRVPAPSSPDGDTLYTGLTDQSTKARAYAVTLSTQDDGRSLRYLEFEFSCRSSTGRVPTTAYINRGAIAAGGRFSWARNIRLATGGLVLVGRIRARGRFYDAYARGTFAVALSLKRGTRLIDRCRQTHPIGFTAAL